MRAWEEYEKAPRFRTRAAREAAEKALVKRVIEHLQTETWEPPKRCPMPEHIRKWISERRAVGEQKKRRKGYLSPNFFL